MKKIYLLSTLLLSLIVSSIPLQGSESAEPKVMQTFQPTILKKGSKDWQKSLEIIGTIDSDEPEEIILQKLQALLPEGHQPLPLDFVIPQSLNNPLCLACEKRLPTVVDFLCAHGANPNTCIASKTKKEPSFRLPMLISLNNPEISGRLCAHGASPSILLPDGKSLLQKTIDGRNIQLAEFLLAKGAKFCSYKDGSECLASAVRLYENEEVMGHLDPNYLINEKKCRIFILRLLNQDRQHNHILLSMETESAHNASPLYFAIQRNFPLIVSAMLACVDQTKRQQIIENALLMPQEGYPEPMTNHIAHDEYEETWKQLLPLSTAITDYKGDFNRTPLMMALHSGPKGDKLAKLLLEQGAQVNIQDNYGTTPLRIAYSSGSCDEVKRLIQQRITTDQDNIQELIHMITLKDDVKMLQSMAESDINSIHKKVLFNELKVTILELAALSDAKQCLKYLLDNREKLKISAEELASSFVLILTFKTTNDEEHERQRTDQLITMFLDTGAVPPTMPVNIQIPCDVKEGDMIPVLVTPIDQLILSHPILNHNIIQYIRRLLQQERTSYSLNYTCIYQSNTRTVKRELHDSPCTLCIKSCPPATAIEILQLLIENGANIDYVPEKGYGPAIFSAVAKGYSPLIELCLKYNANVNVIASDNSTLLHLLAIESSEELTELFVDRFIKLGIDINHQDNQGRTALHIAFQTKNKHMIYKLIDLGCKTDIADAQGKKAFDYFPINQVLLAAAKEIKAIKPAAKKSTHKKSAHLPTVAGPDPKDELVLAIKSGSLETVQKLITQENINTPIDSKGNTPLTLATINAQLDRMDYLVVHGASATQTNTAGQTAWTIALQYTQDNPAIVTTLLKNFRNGYIVRADNIDANGNSILHYAVLTENYSALELIHRNFFKEIRQYIDCYNADGDTPLIVAIKRQCIPLIAILINQYNADLNTPSKDALAPLLHALKANNVELAQLLLNRGASPTCTDRAGNTALHYASIYATQDRIIDLLIERGCDITATNALGERPTEITSIDGKKATARIRGYVAKCSDEKIKEQAKLDKSIKKQELRQKSPSAVPETPASPVEPMRTSDQEISQLPELHHDLPREQLFQLYKTFVEKNDITGLFEYSLDFVSHGITSAQEINTLITNIVEKTPASPSPQLQVLRPTNYIFTNAHYDLLIGGLGHSLENELEQLIATEKTAIQISCYCLTNPRIARALIWAAQKRHVQVEILVDKSCQQAEAHVLDILAQHSVPIYISHDKERMHNKFALFHSRQTVWTGSANFTRAGLNQNHEIALICRVPEVFYQFRKYFNAIASKIDGYVQTIPLVGPAPTATEAVLQPHFTNLRNIIINLIQAEKRNIAIAAYMINDPAIIHALETALDHKPNLSVQIIVDSSAAGNTNAFDMLLYNSLFTLKRYENASQELMHHKCMVFTSQQTVVLGSANLTEDALTEANYENMVVIRDPQLATFCQNTLIGQYLR